MIFESSHGFFKIEYSQSTQKDGIIVFQWSHYVRICVCVRMSVYTYSICVSEVGVKCEARVPFPPTVHPGYFTCRWLALRSLAHTLQTVTDELASRSPHGAARRRDLIGSVCGPGGPHRYTSWREAAHVNPKATR